MSSIEVGKLMASLSLRSVAVIVACCLLVLPAHAQNKGEAPKAAATSGKGGGGGSGGSRRTTINFEDQLVEGQAQKPELFYLLQQRNNNFKRLIRLRENFLPEMRKTSEDVGRPSGGKGNGN